MIARSYLTFLTLYLVILKTILWESLIYEIHNYTFLFFVMKMIAIMSQNKTRVNYICINKYNVPFIYAFQII